MIPPILKGMTMIVITGATGALNGATVDHLLDRMPASEIIVAVRDTAKAQRFADRGVAVRRGDYADPDSLPDAFQGADQLLLVSASDPGADAVSLHRTAIEAALTAGVGRILYTSHQGAAPDTRSARAATTPPPSSSSPSPASPGRRCATASTRTALPG